MTIWFNKPPADLTWSNSKNINDHKNLIKVRGATLAHTPCKQTNDTKN